MNYVSITFGIFMAVFAILFLRLHALTYPSGGTRIARVGVLSALAVTLGIIESFIPDFFVPGVKIGFPNIVVLVLLCYGDKKEALMVSLLRVVIVGLLRGNLFQMGGLMSLSGALLSYFVMLLISLVYKKASPIFLSCIGAFAHGLGQLFVGVLFLGTWSIFYYYPWMGLLSLLAGILSGVLAILIGKRIHHLL